MTTCVWREEGSSLARIMEVSYEPRYGCAGKAVIIFFIRYFSCSQFVTESVEGALECHCRSLGFGSMYSGRRQRPKRQGCRLSPLVKQLYKGLTNGTCHLASTKDKVVGQAFRQTDSLHTHVIRTIIPTFRILSSGQKISISWTPGQQPPFAPNSFSAFTSSAICCSFPIFRPRTFSTIQMSRDTAMCFVSCPATK